MSFEIKKFKTLNIDPTYSFLTQRCNFLILKIVGILSIAEYQYFVS